MLALRGGAARGPGVVTGHARESPANETFNARLVKLKYAEICLDVNEARMFGQNQMAPGGLM